MRRFLMLALVASCFVGAGCAGPSYWYARTFYDLDCRPEVVQANKGYCVHLTKEGSHAQTAHP